MNNMELTGGASRFRAAAEALGLAIDVVEMDASTRTAEEAAAACGCTVAQIVKSLVFARASTGAPILFLVSGANRVDEAGMRERLGDALVRPDGKTVRAVTGYAIGGIPPFGHDTVLETFMDPALMAFDVVWAAAGTPRAVFAIAPADLARVTGARMMAPG